MNGFESAFHFDSLVWDWIIAIYLFLAGMSAGAVMISIDLKRKVIEGDPANNGIMKAMAWLAPFGIISGLVIDIEFGRRADAAYIHTLCWSNDRCLRRNNGG